MSWSPPAPTSCGEFIAQLTVDDTSGIPLLSGTLILDYTRTWTEVDPSGASRRVWRFAVKADLSPTPGLPASACVVPDCIPPLGPHPTAFYYGYVDYALNCQTGQFFNEQAARARETADQTVARLQGAGEALTDQTRGLDEAAGRAMMVSNRLTESLKVQSEALVETAKGAVARVDESLSGLNRRSEELIAASNASAERVHEASDVMRANVEEITASTDDAADRLRAVADKVHASGETFAKATQGVVEIAETRMERIGEALAAHSAEYAAGAARAAQEGAERLRAIGDMLVEGGDLTQEEMQRIELPTLVVWGREDRVFPPAQRPMTFPSTH